MNHYENVMLDAMLEQYDVFASASAKVGEDEDNFFYNAANQAMANVMLLLGCVREFRKPPKSLAVEEGYGAMVKAVEEE